jgi:hypothetical protein
MTVKGNPTFDKYAPMIIFDLKRDFQFSHNDACAVVGNAGHESGGFLELRQIASDGKPSDSVALGLGLFQWSGARHREFSNFCSANKLDTLSIRASSLFLRHELQTSYARVVDQVKHETTLLSKVSVFEIHYEGAGVPAISSRYLWAEYALKLPLAEKGLI